MTSMRAFKADLHLHSCLSPCGDWDNSPRAIAQSATKRGMDLIALTDHNSALNCPAFGEACRRVGIVACYGLEITTREEVHLLALFGTLGAALEMGHHTMASLPSIPNDPARFGDQIVVDAEDYVLDEVDTFLLSASSQSIEDVVHKTLSLGGLSIPAHIDRATFSLGAQLGFVPELPFSAVEVTRLPPHPPVGGLPVISNSDAHYLENVADRFTVFWGEEPSFEAFRRALAKGRVEPSLSA